METKGLKDRQESTPPNLEDRGEAAALEARTGMLQRFRALGQVSRANGDGLARVEVARANARANVAVTAIRIGEAQIRSALVGAAMPRIGALAVRLNSATGAVDAALTNAATAETVAHMSNRSGNIALANDLRDRNDITADEHRTLVKLTQEDAEFDILRTRERMQRGKQCVDGLHSCALTGIERAKEDLK